MSQHMWVTEWKFWNLMEAYDCVIFLSIILVLIGVDLPCICVTKIRSSDLDIFPTSMEWDFLIQFPVWLRELLAVGQSVHSLLGPGSQCILHHFWTEPIFICSALDFPCERPFHLHAFAWVPFTSTTGIHLFQVGHSFIKGAAQTDAVIDSFAGNGDCVLFLPDWESHTHQDLQATFIF